MADGKSSWELLESMLQDADAKPADLPLSLFKEITKDFSEERVIGSGGFSVVYRGELRNGMVAVKKLMLSTRSGQIIEDKSIEKEIACLMSAKHKNIVRFLGCCADTQGIPIMYQGRYILADNRVRLLCFEYIPNGSLHTHITDESGGLEWDERYMIIKGICQGLRYLHDEVKIVHLDLKPANILLDDNMVPKITDFGLSRLFEEGQTGTVTVNILGSRGYMAPEYFDENIITFKADIYSLGVIILEVIKGKQPTSQNVYENWKNRLQAALSYTSQETSLGTYCQQVKRCVDIALNCMQRDRVKRPSIGEIINMLNATETGIQEKGTSTSTELLDIHPVELRFSFEPNKVIPCPLRLTNRTDHRVAFRLCPGSPHRYFTEWLCGVVPPKSTYTLTVTMKGQRQKPLDAKEFLMEQSSVLAENELKDISQGQADSEYRNFFRKIKEKGIDKVHEETLKAVFDRQGDTSTTTKIISTVNFEKMVTMDVHPIKPWIITGHFNGDICIWNYHTEAKENSREVTSGNEVLAAKFVTRKQWIVAGGYDGRIYVYNYDTMKEIDSFEALSNQVTSLAVHPTQPYVLSSSYDHKIKLWDWENGWTCSRVFKGDHSSSVMQVAFNPQYTNDFASVSKDNTIKVSFQLSDFLTKVLRLSIKITLLLVLY